jgi:glycosyltransferase involved in cell wall biosynthesis
MNIALLTPGTGSYHCGVCMRDNALARELLGQGHRALLLPMYLPLTLDEEAASPGAPIFFGGISTYLREKGAIFRRMPRWLDRMLSARWLLRLLAGRAAKTGGPEVAAMTVSMLRGQDGNQAAELRELVTWLRGAFDGAPPDAVWLSTALQAGMAGAIRSELRVPVVGFLQGEDTFLDGLGTRASEVWALLGERMRDADVWIAPSRYFAELMASRLQWSREEAARRIRVIANGIPLDDSGAAVIPRQGAPAIGYLARFISSKGLGLLVDAFIILKKRGAFPGLLLRCAGSMTADDARYVDSLRAKLDAAGVGRDVEFLPNVSRAGKAAFLRSIDVFSVPAISSEAFGLYVIEALAAGVPVVQPRVSAFPELVGATGGGVLFDPIGGAGALADAIEPLLREPSRARSLGQAGREAVGRDFSIGRMAAEILAVTGSLLAGTGGHDRPTPAR